MDSTTQAFVTEIVSRKIAENWLYWLMFLMTSFLAAFAGAYIKRRAENLATRDDFDELKRQLQQTTRLTEDIKAEIGHREWKSRELNLLRRVKLEELVASISACNQTIDLFCRESTIGKPQSFDSKQIDSASAISQLYFPNLQLPVLRYLHKVHEMAAWASPIAYQVRVAEQEMRIDDHRKLMEDARDEYGKHYKELVALKSAFEKEAQAEMERLLAVPA